MGKLKGILAALAVILMTAFAGAALAASFRTDLQAINQAAQSVLMLAVFDDKDQFIANGSGFVAFDSYTLVTNYSVIKGAQWIMALSDTGSEYLVTKVVAADEKKDIALLEFFSPTNLRPLPLAPGGGLRRAEPVVAIGSPQGVTNTVSLGNISALYEENGASLIQFTAPISEGSNGGALFDDRGQVIGITAKSFSGGQNMNLAVDIGEIIRLKEAGWTNARRTFPAFFGKAEDGPITFPIPGTASAKGPKTTSPPGKGDSPTPTPTPAPGTRPPVPGKLKGTWTGGDILITWEEVEGAQEYSVYRSLSPRDGFVLIKTVTGLAYTDTRMGQQVYYYKVTCTRDGLKSLMPSGISVMPPYTEDEKLAVPRSVKVKTGQTGATLTWSAVKGAERYVVSRSTQKTGKYNPLTIVTTSKYLDTSPILGIVYYYTVSAVAGESISKPSAIVTAKMPKAKPTPKPAPTRKPTPTPYIDPDYFVRVGNQADWNKQKGYWRVNPKIVNGSEKTTVVAFTLTFFCEDIYGDPIARKGSGEIFLEAEFEKTIKPRGSLTPGYTLLDGYDGVKYIKVAVTKYRTKDGRTIEVPMEEWAVRYIELK